MNLKKISNYKTKQDCTFKSFFCIGSCIRTIQTETVEKQHICWVSIAWKKNFQTKIPGSSFVLVSWQVELFQQEEEQM